MLWHFRRDLTAKIADLESRLAVSAQETIQREDEIRRLRSRLDELEPALADAQRETIIAQRAVADWLAQTQTGRKIFAEVPNLPEGEFQPTLIPPRRRQVREIQREMTEAFDKEFYQRELNDKAS